MKSAIIRIWLQLKKLKIKIEFGFDRRAQRIVKLSVIRAGDIILHITRIEMIGEIKQRDSDANAFVFENKRNLKPFRHLQIKRNIKRKTSRLICRADVIEPFIDV